MEITLLSIHFHHVVKPGPTVSTKVQDIAWTTYLENRFQGLLGLGGLETFHGQIARLLVEPGSDGDIVRFQRERAKPNDPR